MTSRDATLALARQLPTLAELRTPTELMAVGQALQQRGQAQTAWLGALLVLHAAALDASPHP
jgi:hypothetical protein